MDLWFLKGVHMASLSFLFLGGMWMVVALAGFEPANSRVKVYCLHLLAIAQNIIKKKDNTWLSYLFHLVSVSDKLSFDIIVVFCLKINRCVPS